MSTTNTKWTPRRIKAKLTVQPSLMRNEPLIERVVHDGKVCFFPESTVLIEQGNDDDDVYFILSGDVEIEIHGHYIADRRAGTHVGEMSAINPTAKRSATVRAKEFVVALKLTEEQCNDIAKEFPDLWRGFAMELAQRLSDRSHVVRDFINEQMDLEEQEFSPDTLSADGLLPPHILFNLCSALVDANLKPEIREVLLDISIPSHVGQLIPKRDTPKAQWMTDICFLNRLPLDAAEPLFEIWLQSALIFCIDGSSKEAIEVTYQAVKQIRKQRDKSCPPS